MPAVIRALVVLGAAALALALAPGSVSQRLLPALCAGALAGLAILLEHGLGRFRPAAAARAGLGALGGALGGATVCGALAWAGASSMAWIGPSVVLVLAWVGGAIASRAHGEEAAAASKPVVASSPHKVLDTSVIIDGRIADIIEAGFVEGILVIPQFVLRELQQVADSSDPLKRNRGRKGLDILKHVQGSDRVTVEVSDRDYPDVRDVDAKLLCLAEELGGKVLTNDYNLNKVAQLRGVPVLNVNDLANAMKPVVLPGELLSIQIIKEGKERNQGVGYLDDGTMVVVENGKKLIGQKIEVVVSSVIQTNAGKMIFGVLDDEPADALPQRTRIMRRASEPVPVERPGS